MKVAVVSDTHRLMKYIDLAIQNIQDADILIHLGDNIDDVEIIRNSFSGEIYSVAGNCDYSSDCIKEGILELEGNRIFYTHGDLYGVKNSISRIFYKGMELEANVILFGHTHEAGIEMIDDIILMNPGSISLPRSNGRNIGIIDIDNDGNIDTYLRSICE